MSQLVARLDRAIVNCSNAVERAEMIAEKACYFARAGKFELAGDIVRSLRSDFGDGSHPRISVWIMLAEGLIRYFQGSKEMARDRIIRAERIATSMVLSRLAPLTRVWAAHIAFNLADYDAMLRLALGARSEPGFHCLDVQLRLAMAIADASLHSGDRAAAQAFYELAHSYAVEVGDQLAIGAVMYNRAAHGLNLHLVDQACSDSEVSESSIKWYLMELQSAAFFDAATDARALRLTVDLLRGRVLVAQSRFAEGENLLENLLPDLGGDSNSSLRMHAQVNLARCAAARGGFSQASRLIDNILIDRPTGIDLDDWVAIAHLAFKTYQILGVESEIERTRAARSTAIDSFRFERARLSSVVPLLQECLDR